MDTTIHFPSLDLGTTIYCPGQRVDGSSFSTKYCFFFCFSAAVTLTSWEIFNYILKGLVDEIMELGAKPEVKIVILQLWASYLRRLEVAFMSTSVPHKPRLDINFRSEYVTSCLINSQKFYVYLCCFSVNIHV